MQQNNNNNSSVSVQDSQQQIQQEGDDNLKTIEDIEEATSLGQQTGLFGEEAASPEELLEQAEEANQFNKELVNLPTEFEHDGKTLKICHKTPKQLVKMNSLLIELIKKLREGLPEVEDAGDLTPEEQEQQYLQRLESANTRLENISNLTNELLFMILNNNPEQPDITMEWVENHIPITTIGDNDESIGVRVLQAYQRRCDIANFFSQAVQMPVLM